MSARRILIIEDNVDLSSVMSRTLHFLGYDAEVAQDGLVGLQMLKQTQFDLILLDMRMPVMDGWKFAAELNATVPDRPPILVVTASTDARRCAEEIGAEAWLAKPFELDALLAKIEERFALAPKTA